MSGELKRRFYTLSEIARYLGVNESLIYIWISKNQIPHIKMVGRIIFDITEINRWLEYQKTIVI